MQLDGKNTVVTGGDRGIGRAICLALADKGSNVAVNFHEDQKRAKQTAESLRSKGVKALEVQADVRDLAQVENMMTLVKTRLGSIDILVNNAGAAGQNSAIEKIDSEEWQRLIDVNLTGVFNCCKAAASELKRTKGKIVNMSSIAGKMGGTLGCHYAASKAGVIGLTFALASELAPHVMVNAIAPGPVETELISEETKRRLSKQTPFGRIAKPEEIAHTVIYLLENDYVSGEVIDVNAARYMD